ncbi:hypothetical protein ES703_79878 [subsurface metagenome]
MIVVRDKNNLEMWGLVRSDEYRSLSRAYEISSIILNNKEGYLLDGQFKLEGGGLKNMGKNWLFEGSYSRDPNYFIEKDGTFILKSCYRYIIYLTGENVMPFLQECTYNFIPTMAYKPYFAKELKKSSQLKSLGQYPLPNFDEFTNTISADEIFMVFYNLFDFKHNIIDSSSSSRKLSYSVPYMSDKIGDLNVVFDKNAGKIYPKTRRDKSDIEGICNKLFNSENDFMKFLFSKGYDGDNILIPIHESEYQDHTATLKQWLNWMYGLLTSEQLRSKLTPRGTGDRVSDLIWDAIKGLEGLGKNPLNVEHINGEINERDFSTI